MKNTETPAFRLTADSIRSSFHSSGKRHLLLTGSKNTGKTTLLAELSENIPCITTWAEPEKAVYMRNPMGETAIIGRYDESILKNENKMTLCRESLCTFGISALRSLAQIESEWVSIDEIGYLETECEEYLSELLSLMEKKRLIAAVRRQDIPFLDALCRCEDVFLVDLDNPFGSIGCVIMASGMGKRFGRNKLMADFMGEPMICRVLRATEGIFRKRTVVTRHKDVMALCEKFGVDAVLHDLPHRSDTVRLGLESMGDMESCMFCPADQPLLSCDTAIALALSAADDRKSIWRTAFERIHGSPVVFPKWAFEFLLSLPEGKGGSEVMKNHPESVRTLEVADGYQLRDVDNPEDMAELSEYLLKSTN